MGHKGETSNAHARRVRECWYDRYAPENAAGLDIGSEPDPIHPASPSWTRWNHTDGNAESLLSIPDESFLYVYSSHVLEDMEDPVPSLQTWYRVLAPEGYLVVCVPHRDLYERKNVLPSRFNLGHKQFYLPDIYQMPDTRSLYHSFRDALPQALFVSLRILDEGWTWKPATEHASGEYSIELICRKPRV